MDYFELTKLQNKTYLTLFEQLEVIVCYLKKSHPDISRLSIALLDQEKETLSNFWVKDYIVKSPVRLPAKFIPKKFNVFWKSIKVDLTLEKDHVENNSFYKVGHKSRMRIPLLIDDDFFGVIFMNASENDFFNQETYNDVLYVSSHIQNILINHIYKIRTFKVELNAILKMSKRNLSDVKYHLLRLKYYAQHLAELYVKRNPNRTINPILIGEYADFHDIGKLKISDDILYSTTELTDEQHNIMKQHPQYGVDIINRVYENNHDLNFFEYDLRIIKNIILSHHERWDGSGYPNGLKADEIPIEGRIIAICDVFDGLMSERAYQELWSVEDIVAFIRSQSGFMFDPEIANIFIDHIKYFYGQFTARYDS